MSYRSTLLKAAALAFGALLAAVPAQAAEVSINFGWATTDKATDGYNYAAHAFADALEAAKPGHFEVKFFPNRQLGDEKDMLQGIQLGMHAMYFTSEPDVELLGYNLFSLVVNLISFRLLTAGAKESFNVKGAYLEVFSDMLGSAGVIMAAVIIFGHWLALR